MLVSKTLKAGSLESTLRSVRNDPAAIKEVFEKLELSGKLLINSDFSAYRTSDGQLDLAFAARYMVAIIRDFVDNPVERDILLMSYGFLEGYVDAANLTERRKKYCQNVGIRHSDNDMPLAQYWSDINKNLFSKENAIITALTTRLETEVARRGGQLGYIEQAADLLYNDYPAPNYLSRNGYRKCEQDGQTFYVPLSKSELQVIASSTKERKAEMTGDNSGTKPESSNPISDSPPELNPEPQPAPVNEEKKNLVRSLMMRLRKYPVSVWTSIICLAACVAIIILAAGLYQCFTQQSNVIQRISVSNSSVMLSPGEYAPLYISVCAEDPELDPDWDALQCRSSDAPLITTAKASDWAENRTWTTAWNVLAARDWAADLPYSGFVTVEGGKAEAVTVPVTVVTDSSYETYLPEPPERVDSGDAITP